MNIAFVFIAEAYQCYHGAPIAFELMKRGDINVRIYYNDPASLHHLERIRKAGNAPATSYRRLDRGWFAKIIQRLKILGYAKKQVLQRNRRELREYDAVISVELTTAHVIGDRSGGPKFIYIPHGAGDRALRDLNLMREFDLVLPLGDKDKRRFLEMGLIREGHYAVPGYVKLEIAKKLCAADEPVFANDRPIVLYNPHKATGLQSFAKFIEPMLKQFSAQDEFNLIVAPHIKMFDRTSAAVKRRWRARGSETILIDPGSDHCLDNSYTAAADIYIGDVSSQVYEFLAEPRPCIFLNAFKREWKGNPDFLHWNLGEVINDPREIMPAVRRARAIFPRYLPRQQAYVEDALGKSVAGAARRAADYIVTYLETGKIVD